MPTLSAASITEATFVRDSTKIGEEDVTYELAFVTPNNIWVDSLVIVSVPKNEVKPLLSQQVTCMNSERRRNLDCELVEETESDYFIEVRRICSSRYCPSGSIVSVNLLFDNSNSILSPIDQLPITIVAKSSQGDLSSKLLAHQTAVLIAPLLQGIEIPSFTVERRHNLIGGIDFLKFYVPRLNVRIYQEANVIITVPEGVAIWAGTDAMVC